MTAKLSQVASRRMYSWWWDSHISPKNSKWLQENLTDMDAKVKSMIKLIEQDADSFARRAEMYYEKRPELTKMVEEFYRVYRALAERYDHATGALRQAHHTMTQAFPNEDDELASDANENDPQTPDDDSLGSGDDLKFMEQNMNSEVEEKEQRLEMEIQALREVLAKFEVEKKSSLAQYKQSLENFSYQEFEFSNAKEDSKSLAERANKAEDEVTSLRKALKALEDEKENSIVQYQKCLENIENMEGVILLAQKDVFNLTERVHRAETEAQTRNLELTKMESEKATFLEQCDQSLEKLNKRAEEAEIKAETLKQALVESGVEKEEQLQSLSLELEHRSLIISNLESRNQSLLDESLKIKEDNENLNELHSASSISIKDMEREIFSLGGAKGKPEKEVEHQLNQTSALQQETSCLKEELDELNKKYQGILDQVEAVGFNSECFQSAVKDLQDENLNLKDTQERKTRERIGLLNKLENLEKDIQEKYQELEEKHSVLEKEKESTKCEEKLQLIAKESKLKEAKQIIEIENLYGKVLDMQKINITLQKQNLKLIDEKISLAKDFLNFQENRDCGIEFLKEKVSTLESENEEIVAQLAAYVPAISSLKDCISSLENSTHISMQLGNNRKAKAETDRYDKCHEEPRVDKKETVKLSELQELEVIIKAVELTIVEKYSKLEAATIQIKKLMSNGALSQDNSKPLAVDSKLKNGLMTKDIKLDQISDCYSQRIESDYSIAKLNRQENITTQPNLGIIVEKELGMDDLASENRFLVQKQVYKTKILERFKSGSQKLIDLQENVQDLKKKLEISENRVEAKSFGECDRIGWHLGKAEEDIMLLSDLNEKLIKSVDKFDDVESEQARKVSERIGQLELEVNEIQSIVLKLDSENGVKMETKTAITEGKQRTSMRNYLGLRTSSRKKKRSFCGFVYPPTTED